MEKNIEELVAEFRRKQMALKYYEADPYETQYVLSEIENEVERFRKKLIHRQKRTERCVKIRKFFGL